MRNANSSPESENALSILFLSLLCATSQVKVPPLVLCILVLAFTQKAMGDVSVMHIGNLMPLLAIVCYALAYRGISHDKKLLSDSERLR